MATGFHSITSMALRAAVAALLWLLALSASAQTVRYIHTDALGSVAVVTDQNRNVVERREYEPYGRQLTPAIKDGPGYTGHVQDAATGLTYMQQRYYDSQIGLFLSVDPVTAYGGDVRHFSRYTYAYNNPYKFTDPDGRAPPGCGDGSCPTFWEKLFSDGPIARAGREQALLNMGILAYSAGSFRNPQTAMRDAQVATRSAAQARVMAETRGRLGSPATKAHVNQVATEMEKRGWTVTHGGGRGPEEYLPGPGGQRKGSSYPDITATKGDRTLRVNTVDTRADGITPTTREATNAARIREQTGEHLLLVPKPGADP